MKGETLVWSILFIIFLTAFEWWIWKYHPDYVPDVDLQAKEQCIKNNGIPIEDTDNQIVDCKIYKLETTSIPTSSASLK